MVFRKYIWEDLWQIYPREEIIKLGFNSFESIDPNTSWTAVEKGYLVLGCGGFNKQWKGVYEAWLATTYEEFLKHKIQAIKFMVKVFRDLDAHRIQATVLMDKYRDIKFLEFIGFKYEGQLNNYGPNKESYLLYAMVR